ncbi:MBL fold metallo-hydrolase RNA specificity domain-containing protein [Haliea salexigens]|nr:MBL fold metallo-hydrolase [Haliea salexigens]
MATLTFYGAAQEVTGSCHLLESKACGRVLLDCGLRQGGDAVERIHNERFSFKPDSIDAVVLSHAHLDHCGMLPLLVHQGFKGPIHCTRATADLLPIMLHDAVGLYLRDLERDNLRAERRGRKTREPVYNEEDVERVLKQLQPSRYRKPFKLGHHCTVTLHDAGHILGSAIVEVVLTENAMEKRLVFSGDLGRKGSVLMNDPATLDKADVVLMESTYGDRDHRYEDDSMDELAEILHETWNKGGSVMIPSFAVGRTQEIIFHLGRLHHAGQLDNWEVFLDSPMAIKVTQVYDRWLEIMDGEDIRELSEAHKASLADFLPRLQLTADTEQSMAINRIKGGAIIIAGSGMCTGGRIRHHFKQRIWDDRNTVIFAGFQARGTLGRLLVDGMQTVKLFGEEYAVKARIETLGCFSAHAGQSELVQWANNFDPAARLVLVHGEPTAQDALASLLWEQHQRRAAMPAEGDTLAF